MHDSFTKHALNDEGAAKAEEVAILFDDFMTRLRQLIPTEGREAALVRTKLEEAFGFAERALQRWPPYLATETT